jgi:nucleoside-diphosphate-sugar epimerase
VIHLAAAVGDPGPRAEPWYRAVNVDGTARLLDAAADRPVVWVSSASVYDPRTDRRRVTEDHPIDGQLNAYGRTKAAGERLALDAGTVALRPRSVYGPGDPHVLPRLRRLVRRGRLLLPGPDVPLSLTAVANLADACLAAPHWPPGAYNVADAEPYQRDAALRDVLAATGLPARVVHVPTGAAMFAARATQAVARVLRIEPRLTPYAVDVLASPMVLDISKALAQGWRPRHSLAEYLTTLRTGGRS